MKTYKNQITLNKNSRGCYILDTVKGCSICLKNKPNGCYDNCYAKNIASRYGFDFTLPVKRDLYYDENQLYLFNIENSTHYNSLLKKIKNIDMPFVRIGEMGDPSENWEHTINICKAISESKKNIVIITKHWNEIPDNLLKEINKLKICINTSISALDEPFEIKHRLKQYNKLKYYCNSILRIVSCDFNQKNKTGEGFKKIQEKLFLNKNIIDTVFRPNKNNPLVLKKIINTEEIKFLKGKMIASIYNKKTYIGYCDKCPEMCGINYKT